MKSKKKLIVTFNCIPSKNEASGGGDNMVKFLISYLMKKKIDVNFKLSKKTDLVFLNNAKSFFFKKDLKYYFKKKRYYFNYKELIKFNKKNPKIPILLRLNDTDAHRKSNFIDKQFIKLIKIASLNIFVSKWIKNYFKKKIKIRKNVIIENSVNNKIYNTKNKIFWKKNEPFKIITHHWSNNVQKGYDRYSYLDKILSKQKKENIKFELVGNYPKNIIWESAKLTKPLGPYKIASKLKSSHCYISGSRYESSGVHVMEALNCGLPIIFYNDGGNIRNMVNDKFGLKTNNKDLLKNILIIKKNYHFYFKNLMKEKYKSSTQMAEEYYLQIIKLVNKI
jgi:hypothetical protein